MQESKYKRTQLSNPIFEHEKKCLIQLHPLMRKSAFGAILQHVTLSYIAFCDSFDI